MKRYEFLANIKLIHNLIIFDAGNPYAFTPESALMQLPEDTRAKIYLYNRTNEEAAKNSVNKG